MCPFAHQTNFHKRIGIVYGGIRIGDDAVQSDIFIHVALPAFVYGFFKNLNFLTTAENHVISPNYNNQWILDIRCSILDEGQEIRTSELHYRVSKIQYRASVLICDQ